MKQCYLCGLDFNNSSVKEHKEHIIQQAIGGNLTCNNILCESCGSELNNDIDIEFNKIFETTSVLLGIKRDRKDISKKSIKGKHQAFIPEVQEILEKRNISVTWSDGKVYPNKPFEVYSEHDKKITIYSNLKTAKNFKKKVISEFKRINPSKPLPEIVICDDLFGLTSFDFKINNYKFKKGLAKIAVNYASLHKIPRNELNLVLKIKDNNTSSFKEQLSVMFFYPLGIIDEIIENNKSEFHSYPMHTLILFNSISNPEMLICYIELFSTYQYYVILSDKYSGPEIYEYYTQKILPEKEVVFEPYRQYYKDRLGILSSLGISKEELNSVYSNRNSNESEEQAECKLISRKKNEQRYNVCLKNYLEDIFNYSLCEKLCELNEDNIKNIDTYKKIFLNKGVFYNDNEYFNIESFRRFYIDSKGHKTDYVLDIIRKHKSMLDKIKEYNHRKFYELQKFHNTKNINEKSK